MKIHTLFVQYPQSYPGDIAPSVLDAVDEFTDDDNPDYLRGKVEEAKALLAKGEITDYSVATLEVPDEFVKSLFARPSTPVAATLR